MPTDIVIQAALCAWDRYMTAATLIATTMKPGDPGFQTAANQLMLGLFPLNPKADIGGDSWPR
ncbi:MAG: hypothetical protein FJX42_08490 [Alphaproteobacteria bacterium]|nr:hypothetical protein [Alphaproteobacteria bacterium]